LHISVSFIGKEITFEEMYVLKIFRIMLSPLNILCVMENLGKIVTTCRQHKIKYLERIMNKYMRNYMQTFA